MELRGTTALLLGGSGLVGMSVARRLLHFAPAKIIVAGLGEGEVEKSVRALQSERGSTIVEGVWGNIFHPAPLAQRTRASILADKQARRRLVEEYLSPASATALEQNLLHNWLVQYAPKLVVDCVNTATAVAYQDGFASAYELLDAADAGRVVPELVERHLLTLPLPQLIRHLEVLADGMRRAGTQVYIKIGTSGTGGMGLNIPYTHSEEKPSRTLMSKSAVAGAQTMFLFLLGRTPGAPATIEIKPTAAIAWKEIAYGPVRRGDRPIPLVDCANPLPLASAFDEDAKGWTALGKPVESVFIDVGENGVFARDEFDTVSALGQMEIVTPEEIADAVVMEATGHPTGKDIVAALDASTFGPTYRGGYLRAVALRELDALESRHGVRSVAFEMLGPPRLTKLLYEGEILRRLYPSLKDLAAADPACVARDSAVLVREREPALRRLILSVGLPILLPDGVSVLRGETVVVQPGSRGAEIAPRGWVDLRVENCALWTRRAASICAAPPSAGTGSNAAWTAIDPSAAIAPAPLAVWVFEHEDGGFRVKR